MDVCVNEPPPPDNPDYDCGRVIDAEGRIDCVATCVKGFQVTSNSQTCQRAMKAQMGCAAQFCRLGRDDRSLAALGDECTMLTSEMTAACFSDTQQPDEGAGPYYDISSIDFRPSRFTTTLVAGICPIANAPGQFTLGTLLLNGWTSLLPDSYCERTANTLTLSLRPVKMCLAPRLVGLAMSALIRQNVSGTSS